MIIALRRMQLFPWTEQFSFFIERRCIRKPWYFCLRFPHPTRLRFRTHFRILTLLHQIRFWNQGSCNFPLDQRWFRFELPRLLVLGKNLLQILHGCVFFPFFFRRDPVAASRKLIRDVLPFFLRLLLCINHFFLWLIFLQKNFCVFATLSRPTNLAIILYTNVTGELGDCGGGGWTLVMKTDGAKVFQTCSRFQNPTNSLFFECNEWKLWFVSLTPVCFPLSLLNQWMFYGAH